MKKYSNSSRHIKFCKQNTAMLIVLRVKLCKTSTRHRKNSKQSGIVAIDSCFALFGARQYGATTRENSDAKYPRTLILSPHPELSTPTESRHTTCLLTPVPDPDLEIRGGGHPDPWIGRGGAVSKKHFSALRALVWCKNCVIGLVQQRHAYQV